MLSAISLVSSFVRYHGNFYIGFDFLFFKGYFTKQS